MATILARILQSYGLNANIGLLQNREWGVSSDTEQPAVGTTLGGPKYLGTEENIHITVASPAAIALMRRSLTIIFADCATAFSSINLDIQAGAQIAGFRCKVFVVGAVSHQAIVTYGSGLKEYIPTGCSQEFIWSGSSWMKTQISNSERYLIGTIIEGFAIEYGTPKDPVVPLWDNDHDLSYSNYPLLYDKLHNELGIIWNGLTYSSAAFNVTIAGAIATGSGTMWDNWLASMLEDEVVQGSYSNWRCATIAGNDYAISNINTVAHSVTFGSSPPSGAQTLYYYPHRIAGTASSVRTYKDSGRALMSIDGVTLCASNRRRDRFESHGHTLLITGAVGSALSLNPVSSCASGTGGSLITNTQAGPPITDGANPLRTGSITEPNSTPIYRYMWAGVIL